MQPNSITHNVNNADIMSALSAHAGNPNDIMCSVFNRCAQVSLAYLHIIDTPHYTYWPGMHVCQL